MRIRALTYKTMKRFARALLLTIPFALAACGQASDVSAPQVMPSKMSPSMTAAKMYAKGFDVGDKTSTRQVYVFFDAQCPHCALFWKETEKLAGDAKFTWVPVGLLNRASTSQGAAILSAENPAAAMAEHEARFQGGGISASSPSAKDKAIIEQNTKLLESFGATGVPYILSVNTKTGETYSNSGGMYAQVLAARLGWTPTSTPVVSTLPASIPPAQ